MNGKIRIRHIYKATELKRFGKLEGKYHHMGETHSGGDTMRLVFEEDGASFPPGAVIARKIEKEESGARLRMR